MAGASSTAGQPFLPSHNNQQVRISYTPPRWASRALTPDTHKLRDVRVSGKRRKFTPEFREQAARLVIETGRPIAAVAAEIGVGEAVLGRWVRLARQRAGSDDTGAVLDADERAELERLRKEVAELRLDREFLKKAAAFFASEPPR